MQVQSELGVPADSASTALNVQDGTLTIHGPSSQQTSIPSDCLPRSRLFQDLVDSSDDSGVFHVPVVRTALELWMQYVQGNAQDLKRPRPEQNGGCGGLAEGQESGNGASAHEQDCGDGGSAAEREATSARYFLEGHMATAMNRGASSHPRSSEEMTSEDVCVLMKVADVLIDDATKAACALKLSRRLLLHQQRHGVPGSALDEAMRMLPDHLLLSVLALVPLSHCLTHLPAIAHPLALRAHHPSIDASASIHLSHIPIATVPTAMHATTTLSHLQALCLAGLTLPPAGEHACVHLLADIPGLTFLSLRDIGLQVSTADALAAVLPVLPQLRSLDLSSNLLADTHARALVPAVAQCTSLHTLNLWDALSPLKRDSDVLARLGRAVASLTALTSLAVGVYKQTPSRMRVSVGDAGCLDLMTSLLQMPHLADLQVDVCHGCMSRDLARPVACALAQLTQLQHLTLAVPAVHHFWGDDAYKATDFACAVWGLTQLTALLLDFSVMNDDSPTPTDLLEMLYPDVHTLAHACYYHDIITVLSGLPHLQKLEHLWLQMHPPATHPCAVFPCETLAWALPALPHLTRLDVLSVPVSTGARVAGRYEPDAHFIVDVLEVAVDMPRLRELRVPVSAAMHGHERQLPALLRAKARLRLAVDLFVTMEPASLHHHALAAFVPLFPNVRTVSAACFCGGARLQPLWDHCTALGGLLELEMHAHVGMRGSADALGDSVLATLPCLTSLQRLKCMVSASDRVALDRGDFARCFRGLAQLTYLGFLWIGASERHQAEVLHAATTLPKLRALSLGCYSRWPHALCTQLLPPLQLKMLALCEEEGLYAARAGNGDADSCAVSEPALGVLVRRSEHLRCLCVRPGSPGWPDGGEARRSDAWLSQAVRNLPAFQLLCRG